MRILQTLLVAFVCLPTLAHGSYGLLAATPAAEAVPGIPRAELPPIPATGLQILRTNLSPAVLVRSASHRLSLFAGLNGWGLGGPAHVAWLSTTGLRALAAPAAEAEPRLAEAWLLVWFAGATGWGEQDVPWLVVLQHRPTRIALDGALDLQFAGAAGDVALMPLEGYGKLVPGATATMPGGPGVALAPLCRWWTEVLREFPYEVDERTWVDFGDQSVVMESRFRHLSIDDDWGTAHRKLAPVSPVLGLAGLSSDALPVTMPERLVDQAPTPYGPWSAFEGDRHTIRFHVMQYVNETEVQQQPLPDAGGAAALALQRVADTMVAKFRTDDWQQIWDHGGPDNFCWQVMGDRWYPKALAYTSEPARTHALRALGAYFRDFVLREERYTPFRGKLLLKGPGIGTWGGYDDAGKFSSNLLETLWCYAHYANDWALIQERWPLIKRLFVTPAEASWRDFGRASIAELGDEAAPALCMARMAYRVGDDDMYSYASYVFARELVMHFAKCKAQCATYCAARQAPHASTEVPEEVYLTNLWGDVAGWQIDGPQYPVETGERQYNNRWVRFSNEDVARFHRDALPEESRDEMDLLLSRPDCPYRPGQSTAHIAPSIEQLRSLLLNEPAEQLARLLPMENARIGRPADALSYYLSFVRVGGQRVRYQTLIPQAQAATRPVLGLERETQEHDPCLVVAVAAGEGGAASPAAWPVLAWWGMPTPHGNPGMPYGDGSRWVFGAVCSGDGAPSVSSERRINWTTTIIECE